MLLTALRQYCAFSQPGWFYDELRVRALRFWPKQSAGRSRLSLYANDGAFSYRQPVFIYRQYHYCRKDLWESLAHLLIYTAGRVYDHCTRISAPSSYAIIRSQLYELMQESAEIRQSITAANYIQSRTFLSRSSIMKILAELKKAVISPPNAGFCCRSNRESL